ncbi:FlgO family outer membrane protein [Desulfurivibrio alkaliphilus]|uniref:FlgO domain-containing protein n=1 Tax=Desulfurivibrio alkaliphilus (strain DSM 19089 / UNIQEM U267 / AHT2) TaxID=589865 RepID=D6Z531_DESAT|nr:FlgO family outer membrane protein [Desulfurivibrio alkaliphilus]ADH86656.1 hypothetical protein DaAHT2_1978 [Desulfurivibrio alkaliphilus AHT 2]
MIENMPGLGYRWVCGLAILLLFAGAACAGQQPQVAAPVEQPSYFVPALEARPAPADAAGTMASREQRPPLPYYPASLEEPGLEALLGEIAREAAGKIYYQLRDGGDDPAKVRVAVVAAVPLSDLKRESEFGRVLAEYFLTDLADRGIRVTELRLGRDIQIVPQTGEFVLSRNIGELASQQQQLDYVVLSTYSNTRKTLMLHGRLVALQDGLVRTSWRHNLPLDRELRWLFGESEEPFAVPIRGML